MKYQLNTASYKEGGSVEFFNLSDTLSLGFKQFKDKTSALDSYHRQKFLSKFGLAPAVHSTVCRLPYSSITDILFDKISNWGYITEKAIVLNDYCLEENLHKIQNLVDEIFNKTSLQFWDCHYENIGYLEDRNRLVCIDTGKESFDKSCNAWGLTNPGPICKNCDQSAYECSC